VRHASSQASGQALTADRLVARSGRLVGLCNPLVPRLVSDPRGHHGYLVRMAETLDRDGVKGLLNTWRGSSVEVILRGRDSDAWLARFGGTLGEKDGDQFVIDVGGPEAWVSAVPLSFESAVLTREDILVVHHADGETTVRKTA
jgi:hypothetical protein